MYWCRPHRKRRGMIYLIAFVTLVIVTMLVGAAFTLLPTQLATGVRDGDSYQALSAVSAGTDYAQSRMQNRPNWLGDFDGGGATSGYTVKTPQLEVFEDEGNVIGLITASDGSKQAFRFRFNYQNGNSASPDDGFTQNPAATHLMKFPKISRNNLGGFSSVDLYEADLNNGNVSNSASSTAKLNRFQSVIFVEGMAGQGLRSATLDTLNNYSGRADVLTKVASLRIGFLNQLKVDAAAYAGGSFATNALQDALLTSAPDVAPGNLRSLDTFKAAGTTKLKAADSKSRGFYSGGTAPNSGVEVTTQAQSKAAQDSHWLRLKWSQITKASPSATTRLRAGTYFWGKDPITNGTQLLYYPEDYSGSGVFIPSTSPQKITSALDMMTATGPGLTLNMSKMETTITDSVYVDPYSGAKGLSILVDPALQNDTKMRPGLTLDADEAKTSILSTTGSLYVQGKVEGVGSITSEGGVKIQGTSLFEADQGDAVVLYSKKDIEVESIPQVVADAMPTGPTLNPGMGMSGMGMGMPSGWRKKGKPPAEPVAHQSGDVSFAGAVFAMGNFHTNITNGNVYIRGVLSAYGGDPETDKPGTWSGSGQIDVNATNGRVEFMYDPSYLMNNANLGKTASYLDRISWNLLP